MKTFLMWIGAFYVSSFVVFLWVVLVNMFAEDKNSTKKLPPVRLVYDRSVDDRRKCKDRRSHPVGGRRFTDYQGDCLEA